MPTNYANLKTGIAEWAHRSNDAAFVAAVPDFIALAESRINRATTDILEREIEVNLTATIGSRSIALPTDHKEPRTLWLSFYVPREILRYIPPEQMSEQISRGPPTYWAIDGGDAIILDSKADLAYTFVYRYLATYTLSNTNTTNWLLTNQPDIYLYGALLESAAYVRDVEQLQVWKAAYDIAFQEFLDQQHKTKGLATLSTELAGRRRSNIFEG